MINAKKFLSHSLMLFIILFSSMSCEEEKEKEVAPEVLAPEQIVHVEQAKEMYDFYTKRRVPLIQRYEDSINRRKYGTKIQQKKKAKSNSDEANAEKKFDVARYVSYDYKTLKQYLAYIEQEAKKANVEISGLRIYFSNYPDKAFFDGQNKDSILHPRQNSVLLSPTLTKGKRDYLFYIGEDKDQQEAILLSDSFKPIKDIIGMGHLGNAESKSHASFMPSLSTSTANTTLNTSFYAGTSLTMNKGTGAPPPFPEED
ncbi:hypothetical protein HZY62_01920 [Maribacter polysiphoniae]|uniref:Uncharacterized protein n=1 Tax=Maribacter polysiphoniae TaxID=429344 RepID=A0A316E3A9_9FLAO|nr:hypothetical protein [Maribacter polysiphoniae]MBD1259331.1 hypothetical protein [Maribacter polysiphoniae]PWK24891.1 hypothetical protein LX92_01257 [Maribacter polysiphoniae]